MVMTGVRIDSTTGLVLKGHLKLMRATRGNDITGKQLPIVSDNDGILISISDVDGQPIEVVAVLLKNKVFRTFLSYSINREYDLFLPLLHRDAKLKPLSRTVSPVDESKAVI